MGLGSLATAAVQRAPNLSVLVLDNEHYGETGMQETHTGHGVDLVAIAAATGFAHTARIESLGAVPTLRAAIHANAGPLFALAKVEATPDPIALPPRDGAILQARLRELLLGPQAHHQA